MREIRSKYNGFHKIGGGLARTWLTALLLLFVCLMCANVAMADATGDDSQDASILEAWITVPAADLSGFFDLGVNPFPDEPDPSQIWTSQQNLEILNYWLSLVAELGNDPSLITELYGLGMNDPSTESSAFNTSAEVGGVPEPVTGALLGGGLILLVSWGWLRSRRLERCQNT